MIELLPLNVLQYLIEYITMNEISSIGSLCLKIKNFDEIWISLLRKRGMIIRTGRSLRSISSPRLSFFNTTRLSRQRLHQRLYLQTRSLLDKTDSPCQLKKIFKDVNNKENIDIYSGFEQQHLGDLMIHAAYNDKWKCVKFLLSNLNVDKNYQSSNGATVLIISSWAGQYPIVKWLLSLSDDVPINIFIKGQLIRTSACGGVGPYTAREWADRKAIVCGHNNPAFYQISKALKKKEENMHVKLLNK